MTPLTPSPEKTRDPSPEKTRDHAMLSVGLRKHFEAPPPDPVMLALLLRLARREAETSSVRRTLDPSAR